jgi:glycosyltransferase involved in cell wall biosynthesis
VIGGYLDVERDWSGAPLGLIRGLEEIGVATEYLDATPVTLGLPVYRWLSVIGQTGIGWHMRPEMVAAARVSGALSRRRARPDVRGWVHLRCPPIGRPAPGPYVTFEDLTVAQIQRSGYEDGISERRWARWNACQADVYRHAHACCTVSNWSKASLISDYGVPEEKIHVIGQGRNIDVDLPEGRDWSTPRFLFVGRDWHRKNGDAVVRAFKRVREALPAASLDLVGIHPVIDEVGVQGHGHLSYGDADEAIQLRELSRRATCFVMPSFTEAFALVYLEAASAGLPVIATTEGGIHDALGDDGALYVDPHDDDALYKAMLHVAEPATAASMGQAARRNASPFTWRRTAEGILRALTSGE